MRKKNVVLLKSPEISLGFSQELGFLLLLL